MAETKKTAAKTTAAKTKAKAAAEAAAVTEAEKIETAADETATEAEAAEMDEAELLEGECKGAFLIGTPVSELDTLLADAIPEYDEDTSLDNLLAIAAAVGLDGLEGKVRAYLLKVLDGFFDGMTEAEEYPEVDDLLEAETAYSKAKEDIRRIAQGANDNHQPMTWREAVKYWEHKHPDKKSAKQRAAFFVELGIATTSECVLLEGDGDIS